MYCGTSNIVLPVKNKSFFPPEYQERSRLCFYASIFSSLEVNQTFYKLPLEKTVARWSDETPEAFRFTMKLGKEITHNPDLQFDPALVKKYMGVFNAVGAKKGCLLVQLPPSVRVDRLERLKSLLGCINNANEGWTLAVEFRDRSWYISKVFDMIAAQNSLVVEHDMPKSATPDMNEQRSVRYFRFHGINGDYRGTYEHSQLLAYAEKIRQLENNGCTVYAYFNNTLGEAVYNAMLLDLYVKGEYVEKPVV